MDMLDQIGIIDQIQEIILPAKIKRHIHHAVHGHVTF
jgi:hypothetical protein